MIIRFTLFVLSATLSIQAFASNTSYLIVGGGYNPYGSQVVLEVNMRLFHWLSAQKGVSPSDATYLFGAGNNRSQVDIVEILSQHTHDDELFASMFDNYNCANCNLRHNSLTNLAGSATRNEVLHRLRSQANHPAHQFRFYYTGHGSPGVVGQGASARKDYTQNYLALWDHTKLTVQDFTQALDTFPHEKRTQVVMVQCYSGGFAQMNYVGGVYRGQLSSHDRCGFFAQIATKPASGCSADINQREEYSPYFWAAYAGRTEKGQPVNADYNRDGRITSDEAHAYVLVHEDSSWDLPITTSSQLLRDLGLRLSSSHLSIPWSYFAEKMNAVEKATLAGLSRRVGVDVSQSSTPLALVFSEIRKAEQAHANLVRAVQEFARQQELYYSLVRKDLVAKYKIFDNPYKYANDPNNKLKSEEVEKARQAMLRHPYYQDLKRTSLAVDQASKKADLYERVVTKWKRLGYLLETKILESALEQASYSAVLQKYSKLKTCEQASFFE